MAKVVSPGVKGWVAYLQDTLTEPTPEEIAQAYVRKGHGFEAIMAAAKKFRLLGWVVCDINPAEILVQPVVCIEGTVSPSIGGGIECWASRSLGTQRLPKPPEGLVVLYPQSLYHEFVSDSTETEYWMTAREAALLRERVRSWGECPFSNYMVQSYYRD